MLTVCTEVQTDLALCEYNTLYTMVNGGNTNMYICTLSNLHLTLIGAVIGMLLFPYIFVYFFIFCLFVFLHFSLFTSRVHVCKCCMYGDAHIVLFCSLLTCSFCFIVIII